MEDMKSKIPKFATGEEEAAWWFDHPDELLEEFQKADAEGRLGIGLAKKRVEANAKTPTTTIRLDPVDIAKARKVAERKGLKYQTYLKMLIHEALLKEETVAS